MTIPNRSTILSFIKLAFITVLLVGGVVYVSAQWTGPTATPPNDNTPEPINAGGFPQTKLGQLTIGSSGALKNLFVFGDAHANKSWANEFCLPGTNPAGGCISQWPVGSTLPRGSNNSDTIRFNGTSWISTDVLQTYAGSVVIKGVLQIRGGGYGPNKVLMSDVGGVGHWAETVPVYEKNRSCGGGLSFDSTCRSESCVLNGVAQYRPCPGTYSTSNDCNAGAPRTCNNTPSDLRLVRGR